MWTKQDIIGEAFGELALQGFVFNVGPDEMASALRRLDLMMATWSIKKIAPGYNFPASPSDGSQLDDPSGLDDTLVEAVVLNLAEKLAPGFGKTAPPATLAAAKLAYDTILIAAAQPTQQQFPSTLARGAGNKPWRYSQFATFFHPCVSAPACTEPTTP